jgi:hypothetical protein
VTSQSFFCSALHGYTLSVSLWVVYTAECMAFWVRASGSPLTSDCVAGILIGAFLWWLKVQYGSQMDATIMGGTFWAPLTVTGITILLVRIHPEPADACCKCFEDGVAFAGVFVGVKLGQWRNPAIQNIAAIGLPPSPPAVVLVKLFLKIFLGREAMTSLTCRRIHFTSVETCY